MIGVCIKYFHENYGGMLQAYATTAMLEERGIPYELIRYEKKISPILFMKWLPRILNGVLINDKYEALKKKVGKKLHPEFANNDRIRMEAFRTFKETHFTKFSPIFYGYDELKKGAHRYSAVLTGSDQLWSPAGLPTNFYNLMFVPESVRKISYASSFGVKNIPWYQKRRTRAFLNRMDYISMRENRGAEIVKELAGKAVPVVMDPVFFFDRQGWEQLIPPKKEIEEKYIFAYFLGADSSHREAVKNAAAQLGCRIVVLRHMDQYVPEDENFGDIALYDVGPDRFLNLLRGAAYVCTDSFHGCCFSVIHEKQFVVFDRYKKAARHSKNSRIDTLCNGLHLDNRRYQTAKELADQLQTKIYYDEVQSRLNELNESAIQYFNVAFEGV